MSGNDYLDMLTLPPWESGVYFAAPKLSKVTATAPKSALLAGQNPSRWGLLLSLVNATSNPALVGPGDIGAGSGGGMLLSIQTPVLVATYPTFGPIVSTPWYSLAVGATVDVEVIEILLLSRWPRQGDQHSFLDAPPPPPPPNVISTTPGIGGLRGLYDWWLKRIGMR